MSLDIYRRLPPGAFFQGHRTRRQAPHFTIARVEKREMNDGRDQARPSLSRRTSVAWC